MVHVAELQRFCEKVCDRLAKDSYDAEAFELLHSADFIALCVWFGLDPDEALRKIGQIAEERKAISTGQPRVANADDPASPETAGK